MDFFLNVEGIVYVHVNCFQVADCFKCFTNDMSCSDGLFDDASVFLVEGPIVVEGVVAFCPPEFTFEEACFLEFFECFVEVLGICFEDFS